MANQEHLAILKQGVQVWNDWRKKNPEIIPDLVGADLIGVNLIGEKIIQGQIAEFDPIEPIFKEQQIRERYFKSPIPGIRTVQLSGANLSKADLREANLYGVNLFSANLELANLSGADLRQAHLREASLRQANLFSANLERANLFGADLSLVNLMSVNFSEANLSSVNLYGAQTIFTNFQGATLTGACIQDWNINRYTELDGVICDYIYLTLPEQERRPHDPNKNFASGEFTKLFQKARETVDLIFSNGIDWQAFLISFQNLQVEYGSGELKVQAIEQKSGSAFVIRVEVPDNINKGAIEASLWQKYQTLLEATNEQLDFYRKEIDIKRQENTRLLETNTTLTGRIIEIMAEKENRTIHTNNYYEQSGNQGIGHMSGGTIGEGAKVAGVINEAEKQNLAQVASEIQQLLKQLEQTNPTTTNEEKMAVVAEAVDQIENNPTLKARVINALKFGGIEAFKEAINNPLVNILIATLEGWQEGQ